MADLDCLTTLADVQTYMADTSLATKTLINAIGPGICALIEKFCDRYFALATYYEKVWSQGGGILYLPQYPVVELRRLMRYSEEALQIQNTSTDAASATAQVSEADDTVYLNVNGGVNDGHNDTPLVGDLTALAAAIIALGDGWTAEVVGENDDTPATELVPFAGVDALNPQAAHCYRWKDPLSVLDIEQSRGRVRFKDGSFPVEQYIFAEYSAGYETIPEDLKLLATKLVAAAVKESKTDPTMKSEKWPHYEYTRADLEKWATSADWAMLEMYRKFSL